MDVVDAADDLIETAHEVVVENNSLAVENVVLQSVLEDANARTDAAIQTAEQIAAAAMENARGQEIETLHREISTWQDAHGLLSREIQEMREQLATLTGQISALATLELTSSTGSSLSTPPISEAMAEPLMELETVIPEAVQESVATSLAPIPPVKAKVRRWI